MKNVKYNKIAAALFAAGFVLTGCADDGNGVTPEPSSNASTPVEEGGDSNDPSTSGLAPEAQDEVPTSPSEEIMPNPEMVPEDIRDNSADANDINVTVFSWSEGGTALIGESNEKEPNGMWVNVDIMVENEGTETKNLPIGMISVVDEKGKEYKADIEVSNHAPDEMRWYGNLEPGLSFGHVLKFDVPENFKPDHVKVEGGPFEQAAEIKLHPEDKADAV